MDKTARDRAAAFKLGFLTKLAGLGITPGQFFSLAKKADFLDPFVSGAARFGEQAAMAGVTGAKYLAGLGLAAPIVAGGGAGLAHTLLDAPTEEDVELLQQAELEATYRRLAEEIRDRVRHKALGE